MSPVRHDIAANAAVHEIAVREPMVSLRRERRDRKQPGRLRISEHVGLGLRKKVLAPKPLFHRWPPACLDGSRKTALSPVLRRLANRSRSLARRITSAASAPDVPVKAPWKRLALETISATLSSVSIPSALLPQPPCGSKASTGHRTPGRSRCPQMTRRSASQCGSTSRVS